MFILFIYSFGCTGSFLFPHQFLYSFLAALGLYCCTWAFSTSGEQGRLFVVVLKLLLLCLFTLLIVSFDPPKWTSLVAQTVKCLPTVRETYVWSLGREDPLEKAMAAHSSTLAWKIPWTEEHGRLQSMGLQRVRHDWIRHDFTFLDPPKFCILMDANLSFFFSFCLVILVS